MKRYIVYSIFCLIFFVGDIYGQHGHSDHGHSDIEFAYQNGMVDIEFGPEGRVFEGEFPTSGTDLQFTTEPGFASETSEGMGIGSGDQIVYNVLDSLLFWNGSSIAAPTAGTQIRIGNIPPTVPDTVVSGTSGSQPGSFSPAANRVGAADGTGDFHADLDWFLEPNTGNPGTGAYAVKLNLSTSAAGIANSDDFFIVYNFGLGDTEFEEGVEAFAALVPEPSSMMIVGVGILLSGLMWRKQPVRR